MCTPVISLKQFQKDEIRHQPITFSAALRSIAELVRLTGEPITEANFPPPEFADRGVFLTTFEAPVSASGVFEHGRLMLASLDVAKKYLFTDFDGDDDRPRPGGASHPRVAMGAAAVAVGAFYLTEGQARAGDGWYGRGDAGAEQRTYAAQIIELVDAANLRVGKLLLIALAQPAGVGVATLAFLICADRAAITALAKQIGARCAGATPDVGFCSGSARGYDDMAAAQSHLREFALKLLDAHRRNDDARLRIGDLCELIEAATTEHDVTHQSRTGVIHHDALASRGIAADPVISCGTLYAPLHVNASADALQCLMRFDQPRPTLH